jgi:hypothetical protein
MIFLSLANSGLALVNASAFLLLSAGGALATYILCSSIHALTSWLYSWVAPASVGYDKAKIPVARLLQCLPFGAGVVAILLFAPGLIGSLFAALLLVDFLTSPSFLLLFHGETKRYLALEAYRNVANAGFLACNLSFLGGRPEWHAAAGLAIAASIGAFLWIRGWLVPVPLRRVPRTALLRAVRAAFGTRSVLALLASRGLEVASLATLSASGALGTMLSLKLGLALNNQLALLVRRYSIRLLALVAIASYAMLTALLIALADLPLPFVPDTILLLRAPTAAWVAPVILLCFLLQARGLRSDSPTPRKDVPCSMG